MIVAPIRVVLDANVLFPFTLRDTLLRAAAKGYFQVYWSEEILDETTRNLVRTDTVTSDQAERLRRAMNTAFPEALVTGYAAFVEAMPNDAKDRHVTATAVKVAAQVIVTFNLKDFSSLPDGLEAQSPDEFLSHLFDLDPDGLVEVVKEQSAALRNPPRTLEDIVRGLAKSVPEFAKSIAEHAQISRT